MLCALAATILGAAPTAQAQDIGRLLLSPAERSTVERVRANINAGISSEGAPVIILPDEVAAVARAEPQTLNGWVLRAGQRSTVWVTASRITGLTTPAKPAARCRPGACWLSPGNPGGCPASWP